MAGDVHCTVLYFCINNDIPQDKTIALLNELVEDMGGDPENYDFGNWVAEEYARLHETRPTKHWEKVLVCPDCKNEYDTAHSMCVNCGRLLGKDELSTKRNQL